jgi:hypothetical protein
VRRVRSDSVGQLQRTAEATGSRHGRLSISGSAAIHGSKPRCSRLVNTVVKLPEVGPGQSAPFEIKPLGRGLRDIPRLDLFVEGHPKI